MGPVVYLCDEVLVREKWFWITSNLIVVTICIQLGFLLHSHYSCLIYSWDRHCIDMEHISKENTVMMLAPCVQCFYILKESYYKYRSNFYKIISLLISLSIFTLIVLGWISPRVPISSQASIHHNKQQNFLFLFPFLWS